MDFGDIIALMSILIATIAIYISVWTTKTQIRHNVLSMMPVCQLYTEDFDECIAVELKNKGMGLTDIDKIIFIDMKGNEHTSLLDFIDIDVDIKYSYEYTEEGFIIMPGETVYLLKITEFTQEYRKHIIESLSNINVCFKFRDVYSNEYTFEHSIIFA